MGTDVADAQHGLSLVRNERLQLSHLYPDGYLLLRDDPWLWIRGNPVDRLLVRSLELNLWDYNGEKISDIIEELSELTHLYIFHGNNLKCLPHTISSLQKLQLLKLEHCSKLEELPPTLCELKSLTHLCLRHSGGMKSLPKCLSVRHLELDFLQGYDAEKIGDSIEELSELTHLYISNGCSLNWLPNTVSRLHKLQVLKLENCNELEELPPNLGELASLTHLSLCHCPVKSLPSSVAKRSNLTLELQGCISLTKLPDNLNVMGLILGECCNIESHPNGLNNLKCLDFPLCICLKKPLLNLRSLRHLTIRDCSNHKIRSLHITLELVNLQVLSIYCHKIRSLSNLAGLHKLQKLYLGIAAEKLPENLFELPNLVLLNIQESNNIKCLSWSLAKLLKLRVLFLPSDFRLETLPYHLNDSVVLSVKRMHARKTWKELKTEINPSLFQHPVLEAQTSSIMSSSGYLRLKGNPRPWILNNNNSLMLVRILELEFWKVWKDDVEKITDTIQELPNLTHLYICRRCPPDLSTRTSQHSIFVHDCNVDSVYESLKKLSNLEFLQLDLGQAESVANMNLPISLKHLSLQQGNLKSFPDSMSKLTNLETLDLYQCHGIGSLPTNLNLAKLKLMDSTIKSLPMNLQHLEILHFREFCRKQRCYDELKTCLGQLVNLKTLSITCYEIKSFPDISGLHSLQELQLKDCFRLQELPPSLDQMSDLCTCNLSGTGIQSLPNSIVKLHNLQLLILPKFFNRESLSHNFRNASILISFDDLDEKYFEDKGCCYSLHEIPEKNTDDHEITPGLKNSVEEVFSQESEHEIMIEQASTHRHVNLADASPANKDSHFTSRIDLIGDNSHQAICNPQNQEKELLPTGKEDWIISSASGSLSYLHETDGNFFSRNARQDHTPQEKDSHYSRTDANGEKSNQELYNIQETDILPSRSIDCVPSQYGQSIESYDSINLARDGNPQSDLVRGKTRKIDITQESIQPLLSQNMRLVDAAKQLGVSRSTMKRKLKEYGIRWSSRQKRKQRQDAKKATDGADQHIPSDQVPSECNAVNNSTPDASIRTVQEPSMTSQRCRDSHRHVDEQHLNGANVGRLSAIVQQNERARTIVVKAAYKHDQVKVYFSSSSSVEQLKEEIGKKLNLEVDKFKMKYQDEDKDWLLVACISDLEDALRVSQSSGSNVVRLSIISIT